MRQRVFVIGADGNVGRETALQICQNDLSAHGHRNPTEIVGVANSHDFILAPQGISPELLQRAAATKDKMRELLSSGTCFGDLSEILEAVRKQGLDGEVIFVDATSAREPARKFHDEVLADSNNRLVTANKNPLSLFSMDDFRRLTRFHGRLDFNTTVMAGAGALFFFIFLFFLFL